MLFEYIKKKNQQIIKSVNGRFTYKLVEINDSRITYENTLTKTKHILTKTQADRVDELFSEGEWVGSRELRHVLKQAKSWVLGLLNESDAFSTRKPMEIKYNG